MAGIASDLESIEQDASLYEEKNFARRTEAIDFIEFHLASAPDQFAFASDRLNRLKSTLEGIDNKLFQRLQAMIKEKGLTGAALKNMVAEYVGLETEGEGYDNLDIFINILFFFREIPQPTKELEPEMVYYQKTPARIVFDLVESTHFTPEDVFVDIGSGMGQVALLVHLLAGIAVKGIEFEPAFCNHAKACAAELHLPRVTFINADARQADYSDGTIFFMFTPFRGAILREVLARLKRESLRREIRIITYGPCTAEVASQGWLKMLTPHAHNDYRLAFFNVFRD